MNVRYVVELTTDERQELDGILGGGCERTRKVKRAQILLAADKGFTDASIAETVSVKGRPS